MDDANGQAHRTVWNFFSHFLQEYQWVTAITEHLLLRGELTLLKHYLKVSWHRRLPYDSVEWPWSNRWHIGKKKTTTFVQDTEAVPVLKLSGIPIKEGQSSGSRRFSVGKGRRGTSRRGKREKQTTQGHGDGGEGKTSSKREKRYTKFKNSFMKTRSRKEWDRGREEGVEARVDGHAWKQQKKLKRKRRNFTTEKPIACSDL